MRHIKIGALIGWPALAVSVGTVGACLITVPDYTLDTSGGAGPSGAGGSGSGGRSGKGGGGAGGGGATESASTANGSSSVGGSSSASSSSSVSGSSSASGGGASSSAAASGTSASTSSGGGGAGGIGAVGMLGGPCSNAGDHGCQGNAQPYKLICGTNHTWETNGTCDSGTLCDATVNPGTCQTPAAGCAGQSAGAIVCQSLKRVKCGPDLVTTEDTDTCPYLCSAGQCTGECVPLTDKQCSGNVPQTCDASGTWQSGSVCPSFCAGGACVTPPSCAGLDPTCGPAVSSPFPIENCCKSPLVSGGTYKRSYDGVTYTDGSNPATVSDFRLDRFEITVGRFRAFVNAFDATPGSKPKPGDGAHPKIPNSGWDASWNVSLAANATALKAAVSCDSTYQTWTDSAAGNENLPMNCLDWFEAFAFCAWDGGRLPTEAEWNYAAAAGSQQRVYPWSNPPTSAMIDDTYAVISGMLAPVGSTSPKGDGYWTQADLAGGVAEWCLDWIALPYPLPCNDCANISPAASGRVLRGGDFSGLWSYLPSSSQNNADPTTVYNGNGARCARSP